MKYMDIGCNVNCWECQRQCDRKEIMTLSITLLNNPNLFATLAYKGNLIQLDSTNALSFFYFSTIDSLKPLAGFLITEGKNPKIVNEDLKELAVSFYIARLKMIEKTEASEK